MFNQRLQGDGLAGADDGAVAVDDQRSVAGFRAMSIGSVMAVRILGETWILASSAAPGYQAKFRSGLKCSTCHPATNACKDAS